jgi:hypothetical protein
MSEVPYTPAPPPPPPPPPPVVPVPTGPQFDFAGPFSYVFQDPEWLQKILIGGVFYLAGFQIIGWFFVFGYVARVVRNIIAGQERPLPAWENLSEFFNEGLRLFAVGLVYVAPMITLAMMMIFPAIIADAMDNDALRAAGGLMTGCISLLFIPLTLAMIVFLPASLLFAAVEKRFNAAFDFKRIWAFIKENLGNYLLAVVVYLIARFLGGFGFVLLCIGVVFTGFWSLLITAHAFAQVYRLATRPKA